MPKQPYSIKADEQLIADLRDKAHEDRTTVTALFESAARALLDAPDASFDGDQLRRLKGPLVYVLHDDSGSALYVGKSARGLSRPLHNGHHRLANRDAAGDRLDVFYCDSAAAASALERKLIRELHPEWNGAPVNGSSRMVGIVLSDAVETALKARATRDRRSVSSTARLLLEDALAANVTEETDQALAREPIKADDRCANTRCGHARGLHDPKRCGAMGCNCGAFT